MQRREFIKIAGVVALSAQFGRGVSGLGESKSEIAITIDDPNLYSSPLLAPAKRDNRLLETLAQHGDLTAALFVCGQRIDNQAGSKLLRRWSDAGHLICNHSYSHLNYCSPKVSTRQYIDDLRRGDGLIRHYGGYRKLFRYPFLKEGETEEKRDKFREFLAANGWRVGHVTVDASDWYINDRLAARLKQNPKADIRPYRDFYLKHILNRIEFYDDLAHQVLGRQIRHTLLLHHNLLNALFLGDLLSALGEKRWKTVDADYAYHDPVFMSAPKILPAGESLVWALAKETGKHDNLLRYPGEDSEYEKPAMDALGL